MRTDSVAELIYDEVEMETTPRLAPSAGADTCPLPERLGKARLPSLSGLLRGVGALVIVAAFVMFLFKGWQQGDELTRYLLLIGHTLVLSLAGFASGHLLHEGKGARLFIALALAAVPVNFAFLGGMSYDHLTWDPHATIQMATGLWVSTALGAPLAAAAVLPLTGAAIPVLGAAIWIGFLVLARRSAWPLTGLYLLSNAGLLAPTRDTVTVSFILLALGLFLAIAVVRLRKQDQTLATGEGVFARSALVLPLLVLAGRSIWLYAPGELFFTTLSLIGYLGLRQALRHLEGESGWRVVTEGLAVALAVFTSLFAFATLAELRVLDDAFELLIASGISVGLLVDLSTCTRTRRARTYRGTAALIVAMTLLSNLVFFAGLASALVCLIGGLGVQVYGYGARQRVVFALGLIATLMGLGHLGAAAFSSFSIGGWTGLVLVGVVTVLAGSLIERHGQRIKVVMANWNHHFGQTD